VEKPDNRQPADGRPPRPAETWKGRRPVSVWNKETGRWDTDYAKSVEIEIRSLQLRREASDGKAAKAVKLGLAFKEAYPDEHEEYLSLSEKIKQAQADYRELTGAEYDFGRRG